MRKVKNAERHTKFKEGDYGRMDQPKRIYEEIQNRL